MGPSIIARNYAETLLSLAQRHGGPAAVEEYARAMAEVAEVLRREPRVRDFLETPRVDAERKKEALRASFAGRVPEMFLRFLLILVDKRRQALLGDIAAAFAERVDETLGRVRVEVVVAREADAELRSEIVRTLERQLGKTVLPTFRVDEELIGGVLVRVGDQLFDGSVRRRIASLRRRLLAANLPPAAV